MKPKALVDPHPRTLELLFDGGDRKTLESLVALTVWEGSRMPAEMVERHLPEASVIIGQTDLPRERLERAQRLKAIINVEGNFQPNIDYAFCFERGIHVLGTGVAFGKAVAEMALGLAIALARGIPDGDRLFREGREVYGRFSNQDSFLLSGARVGFIGFGNLGRALIRLLTPFQCRIRVYDPWLPGRWLEELGMTPSSLEDLLTSSQIVFVLAGATAENQAMLDRRRLDLMPKGACLVLVSRASLVDFDALTAKLVTGDIRAAVDVFPEEPFPKDHPIRQLDNVILSAHRSGSLASAYRLMGEMLVDDLGQILKGLPPLRLQRAERETVGLFRSMPVKK
ncbi:MAG TPA: hydroxyacid dehydrogenase [Candidatus Methylomirabilis sp.]|nr:hydroxyacid dehydrogenase [Candidatus Methylomirabilis sp.]HSC72169.1 hydroxyacid dehydrogenase [Candidatus Methylomirabilis sp.]